MILCNPYKFYDVAIYVKCDACSYTAFVDGTEGQTDRCLAHDWLHEHDWKTMKHNEKWIQLCPECKTMFYQRKREKWFGEVKA